jgi:hypothetical protein
MGMTNRRCIVAAVVIAALSKTFGAQPPHGGAVSTSAPTTAPSSRPVWPGPAVGSAAPDFHIAALSGQTYDLATFRGHLLVVEFGSLSCPAFRHNAQSMDRLYHDTHWRAWIMVVYTRENFPSDQPATPRNVAEDISIADARDLIERKTAAETARDKLQIKLPVAVDSMDNAMTDAYGAFPNGAVVIGKDGTVLAREQWTNPDSLGRAIEQAARN